MAQHGRVEFALIGTIALAVCAATSSAGPDPAAIVYPAPEGEPASSDYGVTVNGQPVFCYTSYRFDTTSETTIVGRPVSPVSFCGFDLLGPVEVEVRFLDGLRKAGIDTSSVVVRPLAHDIKPEVSQAAFRFRLTEPCQLSIEPGGGLTHPLHVFANPPETDRPDPTDPNVLYFGPGYHEASELDILDSQMVYVAGGAVVGLKPQDPVRLNEPHQCYGLDVWSVPGLLSSNWHKNVTIRGRGILCGRRALDQRQRGHLIRVQGIEKLLIEGIVIREASVWSLNVVNCSQVTVRNVKVVGHYVNNDGICIGGTSDAVVEDCFSHNADDSLEVKVWVPQRNVLFRNCVVWNDVGGSLGLMHETGADVENVAYESCTVLHSTDDASVCPVVGLKLTGPGNARGFRFENITIEDVQGPRRPALKVINNWDDWHLEHPTKPDSPYELLSPPAREKPSGRISDVLFRNVQVLSCRNTDVPIIADGPDSPIEGVRFENVTIGGKPLVPGDPRIKTNEWVTDVSVR